MNVFIFEFGHNPRWRKARTTSPRPCLHMRTARLSFGRIGSGYRSTSEERGQIRRPNNKPEREKTRNNHLPKNSKIQTTSR